MTVAAKKAAEQVKGIVATSAAAILVLFDAFVAISIVDLARLGIAQDIVGFGYFNKLVVSRLIASANNDQLASGTMG